MLSTRMPVLGAGVVVLALTFFCLSFAQSPSAFLDRFAGIWVEKQEMRKLGSALNLRFRTASDGTMEELRGPETQPLVQQVKLDGKTYKQDDSANSLAWRQIDATHFERKLFNGDKLLNTRRIEISADGKTLTQITDRNDEDGKSTTDTGIHRRTSGDGKGLLGTWALQSTTSSRPIRLKVERTGTNGLKVTGPMGSSYDAMLSGKPVLTTGPAVIPGTMVALKQASDNTIEIATSRNGVAASSGTMALSPDGKTLTMTTKRAGPGAAEPSVSVYAKQ